MNDWTSFESRFSLLAQSLKHAASTNRLSHSYLAVTSNPDLRLEFPPLLAALCACTDRASDGAPCGKCPTCRLLRDGIYPDLYTLAPISKSRQITVGADDSDPDTLRSFEAAFHLGSITESGWKIGVIHEADTMNEEAQNAFLKTLEEPPGKCLFILTTGRPGSLLPTIRSRCQLIFLTDNVCSYDMARLAPLSSILLDFTLHAKNDFSAAERCAQALIAMMGSFSAAAEDTVTKKWESRMKDAENLESAGIKLLERRIAGETSCEYRRLREQFISYIHSWFAQLAILSSGASKELLPNPEIMEPFFQSPDRPKLRDRDTFRMLSEAEDLVRSLRTNVNDELAIRAFILTSAIR